MIDREVFFDKFIEDRAKYYNRTRMSLPLFCKKMKLNEQMFLDDMRRSGFRYDEQERKFIQVTVKRGASETVPRQLVRRKVSI